MKFNGNRQDERVRNATCVWWKQFYFACEWAQSFRNPANSRNNCEKRRQFLNSVTEFLNARHSLAVFPVIRFTLLVDAHWL